MLARVLSTAKPNFRKRRVRREGPGVVDKTFPQGFFSTEIKDGKGGEDAEGRAQSARR